jgi:hypothetical protein
LLKRIIATIAVGGVVIAGSLVTPALAGRQAPGNARGALATSHAARGGSARAPRLANLKVYSSPVLAYTSKTCVINLNAIADFTTLDSVTGCGMTIHFDFTMDKRTVPGGGWASWGSPPNTETATPRVLFANGATSVTLTYSSRSRTVGVEAEPQSFAVHSISATFLRQNGASLGTITRDVDGNGGALLFAGKVKSTKASARVRSLTLETDDTTGFAIARIRVIKPA